jgi:hypothetical protein
MPMEYSRYGMKTWSYSGYEVFAPDGSGHLGTVCEEHFSQMFPELDEDAEYVCPIFADTEMDYYPSCEFHGCEVVFDYISLTEDGELYESENQQPDSEDYVLTDSGYLGSKTSVSIVDGGFFDEFDSEDDALDAIKEQMDVEQFYPSVWKVSDHGNYTILHHGSY